MGFLGDLFGTSPAWARRLPVHLRPPSKAQIEELEQIRNEARKGHDEFFVYILGHPESTRKLQRHLYRYRKQQGDPDEEALFAVLGSRVMEDWKGGIGLFGIQPNFLTPDRVNEFERRIRDVVRRYPSIEALTDAIVLEEESRGMYRQHREFLNLPAGLESRVKQILSRD